MLIVPLLDVAPTDLQRMLGDGLLHVESLHAQMRRARGGGTVAAIAANAAMRRAFDALLSPSRANATSFFTRTSRVQ